MSAPVGWRHVVPCVLLVAALAACGEDDPGASTTPSPAPGSGATASPPDDGSPSAPAATGGTAADPTVLTATTDLLDWRDLPGSTDDTVTSNGAWTLTVGQDATEVSLEGESRSSGSGAGGGRDRVTDALLDDDWAVVVHQDRQETRPARAEVTDLSSGDTFDLDGSSEVPTTNGGTWALAGDTAVHATVAEDGSYCLATVDLSTRESALGWCAPKRHGFNGAHLGADRLTLQTFDDSSPACRTLVSVRGTDTTDLPDVTPCLGWDAAYAGAGPVWSVTTKQNQVENAHFYASTSDGHFDLGTGTSGSLVTCAGSAYFARDPQRDSDPARLMRWDGRTLSIVYESPPGQAFLAQPRCGGSTMNVTALSESGDEQVSADLR